MMGLLLATFLDRFNFAAQLFDTQVYRQFFHFWLKSLNFLSIKVLISSTSCWWYKNCCSVCCSFPGWQVICIFIVIMVFAVISFSVSTWVSGSNMVASSNPSDFTILEDVFPLNNTDLMTFVWTAWSIKVSASLISKTIVFYQIIH